MLFRHLSPFKGQFLFVFRLIFSNSGMLFVYMVCLMTLSLSQTLKRWMVGHKCLMNWKDRERNRPWPNYRHSPRIWFEELRKTTEELSENSRYPGRDWDGQKSHRSNQCAPTEDREIKVINRSFCLVGLWVVVIWELLKEIKCIRTLGQGAINSHSPEGTEEIERL
jgi:hypothetical protein